MTPDPANPNVFLVGAGPGSPGLLTLRAAEVLSRAALVLHDQLVPERLLDLAPHLVELVLDVGSGDLTVGAGHIGHRASLLWPRLRALMAPKAVSVKARF